jgi:hypothetical protein
LQTQSADSATAERSRIRLIAVVRPFAIWRGFRNDLVDPMNTTPVADLIAAGVQFRPEEGIAIAQQLIHAQTTPGGSTPLTVPLGPPSPDNVHLHADGSVSCAGYQVTPAVFEMAILLQTLLPPGAVQVPGALRYAIARGLLDVDVPPYDSVDEFSRGLERFERGERRAVVRALLARAEGRPATHVFGRPRVAPTPVDRRRHVPSVAVLRRELREADRRLFENSQSPIVLPPPAIVKPRSGRLLALAAVLVGAVTLAGVADLLYLRAPKPDVSTRPTSASGGAVARVGQQATPVAPQAARPDQPARQDLPLPQAGKVRPDRSVRPGPSAKSDRSVQFDQPDRSDQMLVPALDRQRRPVFSPAFASNGAAMFFHTGGTRDARSALATMPMSSVAGDDLRVMTIVDDGSRNYHVQPSPDGRFIAFDSDRDGDRAVYLANGDGTNVRRISGPGYAAVPTWAPDGLRVAYIRAEPHNPKVWNLWLQSRDAPDAKRLTNYRFGQPWSASWFPDNRRICYTHEDKVIVLDLDTGRTREFGSPVKGRLVRTPAVSPDGTKVIFQVFRNGAWILDFTDGSTRRVLADPTAEEFAWAPDGRRVAFHSRRDGQWGIYILHGD